MKVVQRDQLGQAAPDEAVTVTFRGATKSTQADAIGRSNLYLPPGPAGGPFDLTPVEAWMSLLAIGSDPALSPIIAEWGLNEGGVANQLRQLRKAARRLDRRNGSAQSRRPTAPS